MSMIGFQEGSRRSIECKGNDTLYSIEAHFDQNTWTYTEPYISAIKLTCHPRHQLNIQWAGSFSDSELFGKPTASVVKAECDPLLGIAGFTWRLAQLKDTGGEARIGGLAVVCNRAPGTTETLPALEMDPAHPEHTGSFLCGKQPRYASSRVARVSLLDLWYNAKAFAGLAPLECQL
ncbi:MAG: hypothetical protein WDW36_005366 [Sanguina aurantia]